LTGRPLLHLLLALAILLAVSSCGKKAPPFLPEKGFDAKVSSLKAESREGRIALEGKIAAPPRDAENLRGSRVYFAQYLPDDAPCDGCPIDYQGYHSFGPEVIKDGKFLCTIEAIDPGQVYFFRVNLVGPKEVLGPSSNEVKVAVE
jgi:predicted small lipoprotein YifL